jgi:hypothetical protein
LATLVFVLIEGLPGFSYPMGRDQATYAVIAQGLLNGQRLYRDLWDNKPPGIFATYAPVVKIFGHVQWPVGLVDILWMLAISWCIFKFAERYLGVGAAVVAVVVNSFWHAKNGYVDAAQPECFLMIAVFLGFFVAASDRASPLLRHFAAGLLLGAAFWLKYNALAFLPLIAIVPHVDWAQLEARPRKFKLTISSRVWLADCAALIAGLVVMALSVCAYFHAEGSWAALKEVQFEVLPRYAAMAAQRIPHLWLLPLGATLVYLGISTVVATVAAILLAEKRGFAGLAPVLFAAAMGFLVTASQLRFPPYAFETSFPFFAMIWGYVIATLCSTLYSALGAQSSRTKWRAIVATLMFAALVVGFPVRGGVKLITQRYENLGAWRRNPDESYRNYAGAHFNVEHLEGKFQVVQELRGSLAPNDGLFVWGTDPLIYFLTDRQPPTRFVSNLPLISPWGPPEWRDELVSDLARSRPAFIVVCRNDQVPDIAFSQLDSEQKLASYGSLRDLISSSYVRVEDLPDYAILRRRPFSPPR